MDVWKAVWQTVIAAVIISLIGAAGALYIRVQAYGGRIVELEKDVSELKGEVKILTTSLNTMQNTITRIDTTMTGVDRNVAELLRTQRYDSQNRIQGRVGE